MRDLKEELKNKRKVKAVDPIKQILDENNNDNVILYDAENKPIEFEQIAVISLDDSDVLYAILIPITPMQGVEEGEGVIFSINEETGDLDVVNDEKLINKILTAYEKLCEENGEGANDSNK